MLKKLFSVFDQKADRWLDPFSAHASGEAARWFLDSCEGEGPFAKHSVDFTLFYVGEFDAANGSLVPVDTPRAVVNGLVGCSERKEGEE